MRIGATEDQPEEQQERADRREDRRPRRSGHVDAGGVVRRRCAACRAGLGGAVIRRRNVQTRTSDDEDEDPDREQRDEHAPVRDDELRDQLEDAVPEASLEIIAAALGHSFDDPATST